MQNLVEKTIVLNYNEIDYYDFPLNKLLLITINHKDIQFDFIAYFRDNPNLLCFGSGAQTPFRKTKDGKVVKPPFFDRWSWYKHFDENYLIYSDPTHYVDKNIQIGWYVGDRNTWYLEAISEIVKKIAINRNIANNNILFYGSSGGGFASIGLATLIKESHVLVNNTQFFVMNYHEWAINKLFKLLENYYPSYKRDEIYEKIKYRLNHIELFKKMKYVPDIHYYVNANSEADINNQCTPFLKEIINLDYFTDDFEIHFYHNDQGHYPLNNKESIEIIKNCAKDHLNNSNPKIKVGPFKFDIPIGFYHDSENSLSDGNTTIFLENFEGDDIQKYIDEYVQNKKAKYNREVDVILLNFKNKIWKATIRENPKYVHYWFEKDNHLFHIHTSSASKNLDGLITKMAESLSKK